MMLLLLGSPFNNHCGNQRKKITKDENQNYSKHVYNKNYKCVCVCNACET